MEWHIAPNQPVHAVTLPAMQVVRNYQVTDRHADTFETVYFDALFAALPQRAAIVNDEYILNQLTLYKLLGEKAAGTRQIELIPDNRESVRAYKDLGYDVFVFRHVRQSLAVYGFTFERFDIPAVGAAQGVVRQRQVFRVTSAPFCVDFGDRTWTDIGESMRLDGRASVTVNNFREFESVVTIYAGSREPAAPHVIVTWGWDSPSLAFEMFPREDAEARRRLAERALEDEVVLSETLLEAPFVTRLVVGMNDHGLRSVPSSVMPPPRARTGGRCRTSRSSTLGRPGLKRGGGGGRVHDALPRAPSNSARGADFVSRGLESPSKEKPWHSPSARVR